MFAGFKFHICIDLIRLGSAVLTNSRRVHHRCDRPNYKPRIQPNHNSPDYIELMTTDKRRAQWDALPGPILVIGDRGFIGQTLVSYLLKEKYSIIGASRSDLSISAYARVQLDI